MGLEGKVAIVTGGARGIGKQICLRLAREGAKIAIFDIEEASLKEVTVQIKNTGSEALSLGVDISNFEKVDRAVKKVIDRFERIDILINNAGVNKDKLLLRMREEDWDKVLQVNLKGAFNCLRAVIRAMVKQREGRVINISSVIGLRGNIGQANYAASKAGIIGLTKSVAKEVGRYGITVNVIAPGFIDTPMTEKLQGKEKEKLISQIPVGRMGKPEEVASLASFLASNEANYITGEVIKIDGGMAI
ncbi:MAG: 3-oxoacyl-[acyl-carrier-protein] reductase [Candidatus Aerophobetes bacterium]|nr:3-oxoacyl-[acyl-carrier-protein] reductase [Candidatus Aerophobetes bacterium]